MLDLFNEFAVNLDSEVNGRWVDYKGVKFLIARSQNEKHSERILALLEESREKGEKMDDKYFQKELAKITADTILLGWEGEIGFRGEPLKYSKANAFKLLSDPAMREFSTFVEREASKGENYKAELEDKQEKN